MSGRSMLSKFRLASHSAQRCKVKKEGKNRYVNIEVFRNCHKVWTKHKKKYFQIQNVQRRKERRRTGTEARQGQKRRKGVERGTEI